MVNYYVSSVKWTATTAWQASHVYSLGDYTRQTAPAVGNQRLFKCTTAGTSNTVEPTWNLTNNAVSNDTNGTGGGLVRWTQVGGQEAEQLAGNWRAAAYSLANINSCFTLQATDVIYVDSAHAETYAASVQISGVAICISVNASGASLPPTPSDYLAGASIATTGSNALTIAFAGYLRGFTFIAGDSTNNATLVVAPNNSSGGSSCDFYDCTFYVRGSSSSALLHIGGASLTFPSYVYWHNCIARMAGNQNFRVEGAGFDWDKGSLTLDGAVTGFFFDSSGTRQQLITIRGVDLSAIPAISIVNTIASGCKAWRFQRCKLNSASALATVSSSSIPATNRPLVSFEHCDDNTSNVDYKVFQYFSNGALLSTSLTGVVASGANDSERAVSYKITGGMNQRYCPASVKFSKFNTATSAVSLSMKVAYVGAADVKACDCWIEAEVLDSTVTQLENFFHTRLMPIETTTLTTDTSDWTGGASARVNSHTYAVGDIISVASAGSVNRAFYCTTGGAASGSLPGAYATAVDGTQVTDGAATFRALRRYIITTASFTPHKAGAISATLYFYDPTATNILFTDRKFTLA